MVEAVEVVLVATLETMSEVSIFKVAADMKSDSSVNLGIISNLDSMEILQNGSTKQS